MSDDERRVPQTRNLGRYAPAIILVALLVWFALVNRDRTDINFIVFDREARLIYIIGGSAFLGLVAGFLLGRRRYRD